MVAALLPETRLPAGPGFSIADYGDATPLAAIAQELRRIRTIAAREVRAHGDPLRNKLRGETASVLGARMANTWKRPRFYSGPSPVIGATLVGTKAPHIIAPHVTGAQISPNVGSRLARLGLTSGSHRMLAIPTEAAGRRGAGRFSSKPLTPTTYEQAFHVKLVRVGKVLIDPTLRSTRPGSRRPFSRSKKRTDVSRGTAVFVLVSSVRLQARLQVDRVGDEVRTMLMEALEEGILGP